MKIYRLFVTAAFVPALLAGCSASDSTSDDSSTGASGISTSGGSSGGKNTTSGNGSAGSATGTAGTASGTGGSATAGTATGTGSTATAGTATGTSSTASTGTASGTGGTATGTGGTATATGNSSTGRTSGGSGGTTGGGSTTGGRTTSDGGSGGTTTSGGGPTGGSDGGSGGTTSGTGGTASGEDSSADCTVGTLPDSGSLTAIAKLPDPFKKLDGTRMTSKSEWHCRREEIRQMAQKYAFGNKPATPKSGVTGTVSMSTITVNVSDGGKSSTFSATIQKPTSGSAPYPAIIVYGGASFGAPLDSSVINSEGVALINYNPYDVGAEGNGRGANAEKGAFYSVYGGSSATGLLAAWAWGVSRIIDVIEKSDGSVLKADAVGVTGCSRFGKGSFLAGVLDDRVALTMPIESGTAGVPIWRNVNAEGAQSLSSAYGEQPWWGDEFNPFVSAVTKAPIDTHELIALVAPRGLFIMDNPHITNLGPISAHIAALAGAEVYKALGAGDAITYYSDVQNGNHCSMRPEWSTPLKNNIERFLKKTGTAAGVIKASASATGNLATWRDWDTPTLP